jgi:hypothetical protein
LGVRCPHAAPDLGDAFSPERQVDAHRKADRSNQLAVAQTPRSYRGGSFRGGAGVNVVELASALAAVAEAVAPADVVVSAEDGSVRYDAPWGAGGVSLDTLLAAFEGRTEDPIAGACLVCLESLQRGFSRPGRPWPNGSWPRPGAERRDGFVHLWFGDVEDPALQLQPIRVYEGADRPRVGSG